MQTNEHNQSCLQCDLCTIPKGSTSKSSNVPDWYGSKRLLVDVSQLVNDHGSCGEDPVCVEEGVEEIY